MFRLLQVGSDLKVQREHIVAELNEKVATLNIHASIVFDAQYQTGYGTRSQFQDLEIFFTGTGETADDLIIKRLKSSKHPRQVVVVTSDNILAWRARRHLAKTMGVKDFMTMLNKRFDSKMGNSKEHPKKPLLRHTHETEMERWLRIFEERSQDEES